LKDEGHKADHGVCRDALRQSVVNRSNLNLRLQRLKAAFNVGKGFLAEHDVVRAKRTTQKYRKPNTNNGYRRKSTLKLSNSAGQTLIALTAYFGFNSRRK
jgi:hypothetical protein